MKKTFTVKEIKDFVHEHLQSKIDHNELHLIGIDMKNIDNFKREIEIYQNTLFEGIINGIIMCGNSVEGIEI